MSAEHSIHLQIAELQREKALRTSVYPGLVSRGKMRQSEADEHMGRLDAAIATLEWCRDNRAVIVEVAARAKGVATEGGAA